MAYTKFATSEPWDPASGERLNKLGDELQEQINVLNELFTSDGIDLSPYLANGWTKNDWYGLKAYKIGNMVFISGVINNGVATIGTQVFHNLPNELRNAWRSPIVCGDGVSLTGYPDGNIVLSQTYSVTQITLSSFYRLDM